VLSVQRRSPSQEEQEALRSLTSIEQFLCGRLISRQLVFRPTIERNIHKYGLEGTIRLCAARAIGVYVALFAFIELGFGVAGVGIVAVPAFVLDFLVLLLFLVRSRSAARSGNRWRASHM
jgi:hypothetical protein